jgi:hypothetical protein
MSSTNGFLGFDQFVWFQGVVEDRIDPLKLGRLRVRILGLHTENKNKIPTNELPWAYPITPITNSAMNGIGDTPMGPVEGTWVVGFFRDGENCQEPVVFGTMVGIPQKRPNPAIGFSDPFDFYPEDEYLKESDVNRLARNEKIIDTVIQQRKDKLVRNIPVALEGVSENGDARQESDDTSWSEPTPIYDAKYPFNRVFQSESGHIKEWDDTKGKTRIHEYHQLGTFYEIYEVDEEGEKKANKLTKVNGENYSIILGDDHVYISGSCNVTVDGRINIYAGNDINIEANEKANIVVKGDASVYCHKNLSMVVEKDMNLDVGGDLNISADNIRVTATNNYTVNTTLGSIAMAAKTTMGLSSLLNMNISSVSSTIINSTISTEIGSVGSVTLNSLFTSVNSTVKTSVGSMLNTVIKTGTNLDLESLTALVNVKSIARINLEAPIVTRKFPKIAPVGPLTFNP